MYEKKNFKRKILCGLWIFDFRGISFCVFLGLSVTYGIKTVSIIVGAIVTVFWLILIAICLIEEGEPHEKKEKLILMLSISTIGIMTLKPIAVKADSKIELTAGVSSYLNDVMLGKIEPTVIQNEPVVVEQTYEEPTVPTCRKKYSCSRFRKLGRVRYGDYTYTWYSQRVLPGGGLNIPGRHLNEHGLVVDENEYVVIASDDLPHGTVVDTPVGIQGIVYDEGSGNGNLDIYCDW